jgi:tight adherence protein B
VTAAAAALMLAGAVALLSLWRGERARRLAVNRLAAFLERPSEAPGEAPRARRVRTFPNRYPFAAPGAGILVGAALWILAPVPLQIAGAAGLLAGVLTYLVEDHRRDQQTAFIENQLATAIDLMVGSLRAGASLVAAFESALEEIDRPLRPYFQEVAGRIRLGDDPRSAVSDLQRHVPLETFRLFATSLAVHWEMGGSLATTLATVGRTVRDRTELSRRVRAQGVESNASVAVVLGIAYVLGFLMWRTNPDRLEAFVTTGVGTMLVAGAIALQAAGLLWMSRLSRSQF